MDNYCRICIRSDGFEKISLTTVSQIGGMRVDDMLVFCSQLEITTEDGLPQQICTKCLAALNSTFLFRKLCYRSDATLREMLKKVAFEQNIYVPPEPQEPPLSPLVPIVQELPPLEPIVHDDLSEITIKEEPLESDEFLDSAVNEYNESLAVDEKRASEDTDQINKVKQEPLESDEFLDSVVNEYNESSAVDEKSISQDTDRINKVKVQKKTKLHICDKCGYSTRFSANFTRHKKMKQNCVLEARISERKKQFLKTMEALSENPSTEQPKVYFCEVCGYSSKHKHNFRRHQKLQRHYTTENAKQENTTQYLASISDDAEVLPESLADVPKKNPLNAEVKASKPEAAGANPTPDKSRLTTPVKVTTINKGGKKASSVPKSIKHKAPISNNAPMIDKQSQALHVCNECDYSTNSSSNILRHQKLLDHTVSSNYVTKQNSLPPPQIPDETEGEKTSAKLRKIFYCDDCGFQIHLRSNFTRHQKAWKHTNFHTFQGINTVNEAVKLKKHVCPKCGERRASKHTLKRHMAKCWAALNEDQEAVEHTDKLDATDSLERGTMMVEPDPTE